MIVLNLGLGRKLGLDHSALKHTVILGLGSAIVSLGLTGLAAVRDLRSRQIPDWIPLSLAAWGTLATAMGWSGLSWAAAGIGLGIGLAVGVSLFATGGFGGGDAKLIAALGAALGWKGILIALMCMGLAGGVMSAVAKMRGKEDLAYGPAIAAGVTGYVLLYAAAVWLMEHHHVVAR